MPDELGSDPRTPDAGEETRMAEADKRSYEEVVAAARVARPRALQHRRGRLRQAPAPTSSRWCTRTSTAPSARSAGASCRTSPNTLATCWRARRRAGRPRRDAAAADARDRGGLLRHVEARRDPAVDVGALRRRGHPPPPAATRGRACSSPTRPTPGRFDASLVEHVADPRRRAARGGRSAPGRPRTPPPTTRRSSTTPRARPGWRRASSTRTATCSRTRSSTTATRSRTASASTAWASGRGPPGIAPLLGPWRYGAVQLVLPARGRLRPAPAARLPLAATR